MPGRHLPSALPVGEAQQTCAAGRLAHSQHPLPRRENEDSPAPAWGREPLGREGRAQGTPTPVTLPIHTHSPRCVPEWAKHNSLLPPHTAWLHPAESQHFRCPRSCLHTELTLRVHPRAEEARIPLPLPLPVAPTALTPRGSSADTALELQLRDQEPLTV